jgi:hypothetical protein
MILGLVKNDDTVVSYVGSDLCFKPALEIIAIMQLWITADNASNMVKFGKDCGMVHVSCIARTMNLDVRDVLNVPDKISSCLVTTFHRSDRYARVLRDARPGVPKNLIKDVATCWNSTTAHT